MQEPEFHSLSDLAVQKLKYRIEQDNAILQNVKLAVISDLNTSTPQEFLKLKATLEIMNDSLKDT